MTQTQTFSSQEHTAGGGRGRFGYALVLTSITVMMASASAPSPFYPQLQVEMGFSAAMMTGIFAVYAVALLCTLLTVGSVSDHVGRRPVLCFGFLLLGYAAWHFWHADSVGGLLVARVIQGVATGFLMPTLSATAVDLEPRERPGSAAVWNAVLPLVGLALGALLAGTAMDFGTAPEAEVFGGIVLLNIFFAASAWALPETAPRHEGLMQALKPRLGLPADARSAFWRCSPAIFAGWATGGLYLSLGAAIMAHLFGVTDFVLQGVVITLLSGMGALSCFVGQRFTTRAVMLYGTSALALGTALTVAGVVTQSLPLYLLALMIAGTGFGTCNYSAIRTLIPLAHPDERGELFASIFTFSYCAFGVPVVVAGLFVPVAGLMNVAIGYGAVIVVMAIVAGLLRRFGTHD